MQAQEPASSFASVVNYLRSAAVERWLCAEELFILLYADIVCIGPEISKQPCFFHPSTLQLLPS